jgi:tripartite-type tricarboxylate transporter receptor subunit TctC
MNHATFNVAGLLLVCTLSGVIVPKAVSAAETYPNRPIRFIAPFVPGGPSDILARLLGQKLNESMGQQVVVDNRGSAGGIVGFELGAKAAPDGYTIMIATYSGLTVNPSTYRKLPYDPQRDFQPITQLTVGPSVLVIHPSVGAKTLQDFVALAKAKSGGINYASTGHGNLLVTEQFKSIAGINLVNVPYKGTGQALVALISAEVQMMTMNPLVAMPNMKSGKLRGLAVTTLDRSPVMPDIPTVAESGFPGFEAIQWHSIIMPARTPRPIVDRLHGELVKILKQPDVIERFHGQGVKPVGSTPEQLAALIKAEIPMYAKLVKQIGLEPL